MVSPKKAESHGHPVLGPPTSVQKPGCPYRQCHFVEYLRNMTIALLRVWHHNIMVAIEDPTVELGRTGQLCLNKISSTVQNLTRLVHQGTVPVPMQASRLLPCHVPRRDQISHGACNTDVVSPTHSSLFQKPFSQVSWSSKVSSRILGAPRRGFPDSGCST